MNPNSSMATTKATGYKRPSDDNTVPLPNDGKSETAGNGTPNNVGNLLNGSAGNPNKPRQPKKPIPAANGVAGPWKTLEYKLSYLLEDLADHAGTLMKAEDGDFIDIVTGKLVSAKALTAKDSELLECGIYSGCICDATIFVNLAEELELINILGGATGAPFVVFAAIQQAVTTILGSLYD